MTKKEKWALEYADSRFSPKVVLNDSLNSYERSMNTVAFLAWLDGFEAAKEGMLTLWGDAEGYVGPDGNDFGDEEVK